jgi:endonuclease/exonuclease/phosphatase family metal-dependent hydrolase
MNTRIRAFITISISLFVLQAIRVVFSTLFGFIVDQIFTGTPDLWLPLSTVLILLAFIAPVFSKRLQSDRAPGLLAGLAALARVLLGINDIHIRYGAALVVIAAGGLYLAAVLGRSRPRVLQALLAAFALDLLLRNLGDSYDLGLRSWWIPIKILWALAIWWAGRSDPEGSETGSGGISALTGLALGCVISIESSLLGSPNAIARWSDTPYALWAPTLLAVSVLPLTGDWWLRFARRLSGVRIVIAMALTLSVVGGYFLQGVLAAFLLLAGKVLLLLSMTILIMRPQRGTGAPFGYGMAVLLLFNFYTAFSFTYAYTLAALRDLGWISYLGVGLVIVVGMLASREPGGEQTGSMTSTRIILIGALAVAASVIRVLPQAGTDPMEDGALRFATYNIHYGYDGKWRYMLDQQANTIAESGADFVALQEVDTGRITSYGVDNAYYLARRLGMQVEYLPTVEHLTGIAVLYRGQAAAMASDYLTSPQEQTGIIAVELASGVTCFGVWLGLSNEDTLDQIDEALSLIGETNPACFGGDFNAEPDSELIGRVRAAGFIDPFETLGIEPAPLTSPAEEPAKRIDFVFIRGLVPFDARVPDSVASDHRLVVIEAARFP